ncbi:hypothetical protein [Streptomyces sp. JJ36]|uniref:hypothetical protein n=1 Tax=Streptomyces sp. JJ36 TaxID=2736645 RepID=UPI001F440976|nr:hypothetical protein [Streptomyces sp. JJ36]MCF6523763.1 hypothetical protein [Streptomyces sp. JJ36]
MPTDHACQAAADEAARAITPVRGVLAPAAPTPASAQESVPVVLRQYYGDGGSGAGTPEATEAPPPEPAGTAMGAVVLHLVLDGLRADLSGSLVGWYARLPVRVPHAVGAPAAAAPELEPPAVPGEWEALGELKFRGQELLTLLADRGRTERVSELGWRLALVEDAFAGGLRRLEVPAATAVRCAAQVSAAAGSLFGVQHPAR